MNKTTAHELVDQVEQLPPLPDTVMKLTAAINDPLGSVDDIVGVIKYDQAATSEVLRLCNSAFFGLTRQVTSLNEAMLCLGTVKVLQLVMSVHTSAVLAGEQKGYGLPPGMLWRHSVAVAIASSIVAKRLEADDVNLAFTAGLLHDVGKVLLNTHVASEFTEIVDLVTHKNMSFVEAEHERLGFSHPEVGQLIAQKWQLPDGIVNAIRYHHEPWEMETPDVSVDCVYIADCLCLLLGIGLGEDGLQSRADSRVMERNNLRERDLEMIGLETMLELKKVEELFVDAGKPSSSKTGKNKLEANHVS